MTAATDKDWIEADTFLARELADLLAKGMDEDRAITIVLNTYKD
jgi:hypothetical protein